MIPNKYQNTGEGAIASYSYIDIAEGTGIYVFNGAEEEAASGKTYFLTTNTPYSNSIVLSGAVAGGSGWVNVVNKDFDVKFITPKNLKGKARFTAAIGGTNTTGTGSQLLVFSGAKLIHVNSAATETVLATVSGAALSLPSASTTYRQVQNIPFGDVALKHFKSGETLRLHLELWGINSGTMSIDNAYLGIDPANRTNPHDGSANTTKLELYVPFKLDL